MENMTNLVLSSYKSLSDSLERLFEINLKLMGATREQMKISQTYCKGLTTYLNDFMTPFRIALNAFSETEKDKLRNHTPYESLRDYVELLQFNLQVAEKGLNSSVGLMSDYHSKEATEAFSAWLNTVFDRGGEDIETFMGRQSKALEQVVYAYPRAILEIGSEYGFHFDSPGYEKTAETDRFLLYQVLPNVKKVKPRKNGKPIIIIPPYVLGANILAFLPGENKSYVHAFANEGIPTYIRIMKDIDETPAVQIMTGEDDALDTRFFCETLKKKHRRQVTLNGFCQGGFIAVLNLLSGELDGLVDALITCVTPMDGTRSKSLVEYMEHLPPRFRDLGYAVKTLPNGNQVVDGKVMSWVYKLKSMEKEAPIFAFYRDLMMFNRQGGKEAKISKTAAALNHWLIYDRNDLPVAITKMSFDSYTIPVDKDGTLPVKLFDRKLNFKRLKEKGIRFLICYAEQDDLVDEASALAPLDYIDAEVSVFPKGHGAIATSWSLPSSECALHTRFGDECRGPVRYQLDLEAELNKERKKS
ncbi:MAG: metal transporter [Deltaproteobacteria bacterium]|nr:metal transporter [Deltaproteobacteria bacterium]